MSITRRKFTSKFKVLVAIEVLKKSERMADLAKRFELHPNQIGFKIRFLICNINP